MLAVAGSLSSSVHAYVVEYASPVIPFVRSAPRTYAYYRDEDGRWFSSPILYQLTVDYIFWNATIPSYEADTTHRSRRCSPTSNYAECAYGKTSVRQDISIGHSVLPGGYAYQVKFV